MRNLPFAKMLPLYVTLAVPAMTSQAADLTDLTNGDPFFYTRDQNIKPEDKQKELLGVGRPNKTHSQIPHLPVYMGYMNTNTTYRFVNVAEQVLTMIGEGKHGLWRIQENGTVREYLKKGAAGLPQDADLMAKQTWTSLRKTTARTFPMKAGLVTSTPTKS